MTSWDGSFDLRPEVPLSADGTTTLPARCVEADCSFVIAVRGLCHCALRTIAFGCVGEVGLWECSCEIIRNDADGILVPPDDVEALAETIDRLLSRLSDQNRRGERAAELATCLLAMQEMALWEN